MSLIYAAAECPLPTEKSHLASPRDLFTDDCFPNVHTFHIAWKGSLAEIGMGSGVGPMPEIPVKTFICEIDPPTQTEVEMLFHQFNFPDLRHFTQKFTLALEEVQPGTETIGKLMQQQPMDWATLETLTLDLTIEAIMVENVSICVCLPFKYIPLSRAYPEMHSHK
jgi:hypothetical protein